VNRASDFCIPTTQPTQRTDIVEGRKKKRTRNIFSQLNNPRRALTTTKFPAYGVNLEGVVEASLVAADARVDARHVASCGFVHDLWVSQKRPSHGDQIRVAVGQHRFNLEQNRILAVFLAFGCCAVLRCSLFING
jgi:hypothetical protein